MVWWSDVPGLGSWRHKRLGNVAENKNDLVYLSFLPWIALSAHPQLKPAVSTASRKLPSSHLAVSAELTAARPRSWQLALCAVQVWLQAGMSMVIMLRIKLHYITGFGLPKHCCKNIRMCIPKYNQYIIYIYTNDYSINKLAGKQKKHPIRYPTSIVQFENIRPSPFHQSTRRRTWK